MHFFPRNPATLANPKPYTQRVALKAHGPDQWSNEQLRALTLEQCRKFAGILRQAELTGVVPYQWVIAQVILLPRNEEVEHPIGLMHTLHILLKLRYSLVNAWIEEVKPTL